MDDEMISVDWLNQDVTWEAGGSRFGGAIELKAWIETDPATRHLAMTLEMNWAAASNLKHALLNEERVREEQ